MFGARKSNREMNTVKKNKNLVPLLWVFKLTFTFRYTLNYNTTARLFYILEKKFPIWMIVFAVASSVFFCLVVYWQLSEY